jgi:hypothetical protein
MNLLLSILACTLQAPEPASPQVTKAPTEVMPAVVPLPGDASLRLDIVLLKNGDELVGRVTAELDGYVEVEIADGATVGVSRAMVKEVRREAVVAPLRAAVVRPDNTWFVLHDADGAAVGWLHTSITTANNGTFSVNEEYEFINGARRYQITSQCTASSNGQGLRCYYRERVSRPKLAGQLGHAATDNGSSDRIEDERIVEAAICDGQLQVTHLDGHGRSERMLPWSGESTFPLLARTLARQSVSVIGPVSMFDPANEELVVRRVDGTGARQILLDGVKKRVGEIAETNAVGTGHSNREWVDADLKIVRREISGPALVAVPSSASSARSAVGVSSIDSAIVAEADGRFGLWIPNPAWRAVEPLPAGHLQLQCAVHDAEIRLSLIDHLAQGTLIETAADAVANWFALLYPQLTIDSRYANNVRGRSALRMSASDRGNQQKAVIDVIPFHGQFLVMISRAPKVVWDELSGDFTFVRRTLELDAAALNPMPQGPLSLRRGGRMRPPTGPVPAPTPAPRIEKSDEEPNVRIPK